MNNIDIFDSFDNGDNILIMLWLKKLFVNTLVHTKRVYSSEWTFSSKYVNNDISIININLHS